MNLTDLGWNPFFQTALDALSDSNLVPARVTRQDKHRYRVLSASGPRAAVVAGRLRHDPDGAALPAVGHWVAMLESDEDELALIQAVLPRRSVFSRKQAGNLTRQQAVAANIDTVFLVSGLDGDFNLRRIERYVTQAWNSGATPVILLNKADLCEDLDARIHAVESVAMGVAVHALSAKKGDGLAALAPYLGPGQTVALLGSSGVGKSTLVNQLMGAEHLKTNAVRADDSRGRHTTTHRELVLLPGGGMLIDTPGMRELQMWGSEEDLEGAFADIEALAASCRFRDCGHETEPGCAVQEALDEGTLDEDRFQSYLKLKKELDYLARRQDEVAALQERRREKEFGRLIKTINKHNPKKRP